MKVKMRQDLAEERLAIPCKYQEGAYLLPYQIEESDYLGEVKEGEAVLLLPYQNGMRFIAIVDSIDLDFIEEGEK